MDEIKPEEVVEAEPAVAPIETPTEEAPVEAPVAETAEVVEETPAPAEEAPIG